jgi:hypothetical protein
MAETGLKVWATTGGTDVHLLRPGTKWGKGAPSVTRGALDGDIRAGGPLLPKANVNLFPTDVGTCLLDSVLPASIGALPPDLALTLGHSAASVVGTAWKVNTVEFTLEVNGALELNYEIVAAAAPTDCVGGAPANRIKTMFEWYNATVTGETAKAIRRVTGRIGNNIAGVYSLLEKDDGERRFPDGLEAGPLTCSADVEYLEASGVNPDADELAEGDLEIVAVNVADPAQSITIAITGMKIPEEAFEAAAKAEFGRFTYPYELDDNELASIAITLDDGAP